MANNLKKALLLIIFFSLSAHHSFAQNAQSLSVVTPDFKDKYSEFVKQLELGKTDINYKEFRESFIESEQFKTASKKAVEFEDLEKEMYSLMRSKKYLQIVDVTKKMLSIDYTSMLAHKILRQTYKIIGDTSNASKYKSIQFGLLNSIVHNGDGKTCATAWPVIQIAEEYFILQMLGASLLKQRVDKKGGICDEMQVKTEEGNKGVYYFGISKVVQGYDNLGIK